MDRVFFFYRIERRLYKLHLIPLAVIVRAFMRIVFACDIPYKLDMGKGCVFPHDALGVVIHPDAVIGENVQINQNVTIGGRSDLTILPIIESGVIIGANSVVLGDIVIGKNAVIGAGSVVISNIPENAVAVGVPAKVRKIKSDDK